MLTRFVRIQLIIFTIASIIGVMVMAFVYLQLPVFLGMGRITVSLELPATGGLYRFSNVTYRGVQVGKVTAVRLTRTGVVATMSLDSSPRIPADLQADVRSVSAVGEQYVDLRPRTGAGPYLSDGSTIKASDATIPQPVGPMLDKVSALVSSLPKDKLSALLDESFKGLDGAGYDFGSLLDSSSKFAGDLKRVSEQARTLVDDSGPLLDGQVASTDAIRVWSHSLAGVTEQFVANDPQIRTLLHTGPGFANEAAQLLAQVKPTLPVLLANFTTIGQIGVTYNASLEQILVLLPPTVASLETYGLAQNNEENLPKGNFSFGLADPPACTVGFLPPSAWRSPADTSVIDTPDGLYCKLPQDSPLSVRGARNLPCMGHPGKRAPTVEICDSDKPFIPLAQRQHATGPYPLDPNLIAQGVPPDDRVDPGAQIYGPLEGTPLPADAPRPPAPPIPPDPPSAAVGNAEIPLPPVDSPPPAGADPTSPNAAPSSFVNNGPGPSPSVAIVRYDPRNGAYVAPDGQHVRQTDLVATGSRTWRDLLLN